MDSGKPSGQSSSLDSLRTVEFRQTLRGYHIDDVDEYLERVAVDAEALQEQVRQAGERLKQAAERIAQLEAMLQEVQLQPQSSAPVSDDTLQRTLLLAQRFVDQTQAEAEAQARVLVADAEERARRVLGEAEARAKSVTEDTERHLREEITRLEAIRAQLAGDVETIGRHMENERNRLRGALSDMLNWVDEHVQPSGSILAQRPPAPRPAPPRDDLPPMSAPRPPGDDIPTVAAPDPVGGSPGHAVPVQGNAASGGARPETEAPTSQAERQGVMSIDDTSQPQAIAPH
jgi:DivIVA domain-containing protein